VSVPESVVRAVAHLPAPCGVVDLAAFRANAQDLVRRAGGLPIRVASKSVRCRPLLEQVLERPGFAGVMAYSLREAIWLVRHGQTEVLLAYPSVDRAAMAELAAEPVLTSAITVMVDHPGHVAVLASAADRARPVRVCLEVDASLRIGPAHLGVRRSPVHTPDQAARAARRIAEVPGVRLVGLMFYDAQIAGLPDSSPAVRLVKRLSARELLARRGAVVRAVRPYADLEIVNGGGTGSLHVTGRDPHLTELAAGSGLYGPTLFDGYRDFSPEHAAYLVLPVVRRPAPDVATCFSGGYIASGPPGWSRVPQPCHPEGLRLLRNEGAGEVQTPVSGEAARHLSIGDPVWFRHAKAGELCERLDEVHRVDDGEVVASVPSYRGVGLNFG
jgi:D-serine deaminase-like pyridoxal phosphate-dependent protein